MLPRDAATNYELVPKTFAHVSQVSQAPIILIAPGPYRIHLVVARLRLIVYYPLSHDEGTE